MRPAPPPVGLDTETHRGRAILLCTGSSGRSLLFPAGFTDVARWLLAESRYVVWNVTYDAQAVLAWLPKTVLRRLGAIGTAERGGVRIRWVPDKLLELREARPGGRSCVVTDAFPYYQSGLDAAARATLGEGKREVPRSWLRAMRTRLRDARTRGKVLSYCAWDATLAERLYARVAGPLRRLGARPSRPVSPGSYAAHYFRGAMAECRVERRLSRLADRAYWGGRIECLARGFFPRADVYDIRSAYPAVLADCIAPRACVVSRGCEEPRPDAAYGLFRVRWDMSPGETCYPVPREADGSPGLVTYPCGSWEDWTDLHTCREGIARGYVAEVLQSVQWLVRRPRRPFRAGIRELWKLRRDPELSQAAKLVLNSAYGKLAERVRRAERVTRVRTGDRTWWEPGAPWCVVEREPKHASVLVAAHVTASVRMRVYRALAGAGEAAVFAATDSVALLAGTRPPHPLGTALGAWKPESRSCALLVVGAGVYARRDAGARDWRWKTRGFHAVDLRALMLAAGPGARSVRLSELRAVSLRQLARWKLGRWEDMNVLRATPRRLDLGFDRKRWWPLGRPSVGRLLAGAELSLPLWYHGAL